MNVITGYISVCRFIGGALIAISAVLLLAGDLGAQETPLRTLRGNNYAAAREARDSADLMRADLEKRLSGPPASRPKISQEGIDAEADKIEQTYQEVIDRYPRTEIAADCATSLCSFYLFRGKMDKAAELTERIAKEFADTKYGGEALLEMGLVYLQVKRDPAEAIKWFSRISNPAGAEYGTGGKFYLAAQQQLVKCELQLHQDAEAQDRVTKLKEAYPQFADELERSYKFEIKSRNQSGNKPSLPLNQKPRQTNAFNLTLIVTGLIIIAIAIIRLIYLQLKERRKL